MNKIITATLITAVVLMASFSQAALSPEDFLGGIDILGQSSKIDLKNYKEKAINIVKEGLSDPTPSIKMHAIEIAATTKSKELLPMVLNMLNEESVTARFAAAVAMGDAEYKASVFKLKELIKDPDENVRMAAAYSQIKMGDTESGLEAHILRGFLASTDHTVKANAAMLLGKLGDKRALPPLWDALRSGSDNDRFRIQAVESIAMLKDEQIYNKIWGMLISKFVDDRIMGIRAMSALGTIDAQNSINTMLDDDVEDVKICAAYEMGKFRSKAGEPVVLEYLSANSANLDALESGPASHLAIMAIGTIKSQKLNEYLPKLLDNPKKDLKLAAAQSLLMNVK